MKKQEGFTLTELVIVIAALGILAGIGGLIYVGIHFISKVW